MNILCSAKEIRIDNVKLCISAGCKECRKERAF
jgi:hypothetical protein